MIASAIARLRSEHPHFSHSLDSRRSNPALSRGFNCQILANSSVITLCCRNNSCLYPQILQLIRFIYTLSEKWERVKGIEPSSPPWEGGILPVNYTRGRYYCNI